MASYPRCALSYSYRRNSVDPAYSHLPLHFSGMPQRHSLPEELLQIINEVKKQRSDKTKGQILLDKFFIISVASIILGLLTAVTLYYLEARNFAIWILIVALVVCSALFAAWVTASIVVGVKEEKFQLALARRIAFDEDAIARFFPFPVDALKIARAHLEREHTRMTARRTTGLYLLASPAVLVTIISLAQQSSSNPAFLLLRNVAKWLDGAGSFGFGIMAAALLLGFLIGGFANNVRCETLGRLMFVVGEAERRKRKNQ